MAYFGSSTVDHDGFEFNFGGYTNGDKGTVRTCPGSGNQTVNTLELFGRSNDAGVSYNCRIAVYSTNLGTLLGDSATISVSTVDQWHSGAPDGAFNLTGGSNYSFCCSYQTGGNNLYWGYQDITAGYAGYQAGDYTAVGFPASVALGSDHNRQPELRVDVTAAGGGGCVKQASTITASRRRAINNRSNSGLIIV